tara:strand:- start:9564 stop:10133 length:570 start_codon:yes stop_codon:yes gene_type:complete
VIEALFKNISIILFISCLKATSTEFIILNNYVPYENSLNNLGIQIVEIDNKKRYYFNYQSWVTNNFYIDGYVSQYNSPVDILYGTSLGYKSDLNFRYFKEIVYSVGYSSKRFSDKNISLSNISIMQSFHLKKIRSFIYINYFFNNDIENRSITLKFLKALNKDISIHFGLDYNDDFEDFNGIIGLYYKL